MWWKSRTNTGIGFGYIRGLKRKFEDVEKKFEDVEKNQEELSRKMMRLENTAATNTTTREGEDYHLSDIGINDQSHFKQSGTFLNDSEDEGDEDISAPYHDHILRGDSSGGRGGGRGRGGK